eukprot:70050-Lingulodinium_polyedra.AAC.1
MAGYFFCVDTATDDSWMLVKYHTDESGSVVAEADFVQWWALGVKAEKAEGFLAAAKLAAKNWAPYRPFEA